MELILAWRGFSSLAALPPAPCQLQQGDLQGNVPLVAVRHICCVIMATAFGFFVLVSGAVINPRDLQRTDKTTA